MVGGFSTWLHWKVMPFPALARWYYRLRHGLGKHFARYQDFPEDVIWREDCRALGETFLKTFRNSHRAPAHPAGTRVVFLLETMENNGGTLSVVQLAEDLQALGWDVHLAVRNRYHFTRLTEKVAIVICPDDASLLATMPGADFIVATYWTTCYAVMQLYLERKNFMPLYFVQDIETGFYPAHYAFLQECIAATYRTMPCCFAKTSWLCEQVRSAGGTAAQVVPGLDLERFHPSEQADAGTKKILLMMFRPETPRRGNAIAVEVLQDVLKDRDDLEIHFFGAFDEALSALRLPFPYTNHGIVDNANLPDCYRQAYLYLDCSNFHGFGRTVAEAMACGIPCVLTDSGGVRDFALHEKNCLMSDPDDVAGLSGHIRQLLENPALRNRLAAACPGSVQPYARMKSAHATAALWQRWISAD